MKKQLTKQKVPTVTVSICAYNEEGNITAFLMSVLKQKLKNIIVEKILVISDGSTDTTVKKIKSLKSPLIEVRDYKERLGKSTRLNEIYSSLKSDLLVQSDADVVFANNRTIENLLKPILFDFRVGMCGGNPIPLKAKTFTEKAVNVTCEVYSKFRQNVRGGDNIFSADGRLLAFRKKLVKKISVPHDMIANDQYAYFACLTFGEKYKFAKNAIVHFRSPQTLKDQIRQNTRFSASPIRLSKYFPDDLVYKETYIPIKLRLKAYFSGFAQQPILSSYIFIINTYCRIKALNAEKKLSAKWPIAISTKSLK